MDDTTQKNDKPGYDDTEGYALELIERWKRREQLKEAFRESFRKSLRDPMEWSAWP